MSPFAISRRPVRSYQGVLPLHHHAGHRADGVLPQRNRQAAGRGVDGRVDEDRSAGRRRCGGQEQCVAT